MQTEDGVQGERTMWASATLVIGDTGKDVYQTTATMDVNDNMVIFLN